MQANGSTLMQPPSASSQGPLAAPPELLAKVTRRLVPFLILLYFVAYLDRVNVGFAALTMNKDLGISPYLYGWGAGIFFLVVMGVYGLGFWLPQIIKRFGVSDLAVGFLTAIPYLVAALVQVFWCRHSDAQGERRWHFAIPCLLMAGGFTMSALSPSPYISFAGLILSAIGLMCAQPMFWTMPSTILTGTAAAGGIALINSIGNLGGFAGPYLVGWVAQVTKNPAFGLIVLTGALLIAAGLVLAMRPENVGERRRQVVGATGRASETL
jgi:nitrate/nitrite transporter NarK